AQLPAIILVLLENGPKAITVAMTPDWAIPAPNCPASEKKEKILNTPNKTWVDLFLPSLSQVISALSGPRKNCLSPQNEARMEKKKIILRNRLRSSTLLAYNKVNGIVSIMYKAIPRIAYTQAIALLASGLKTSAMQ